MIAVVLDGDQCLGCGSPATPVEVVVEHPAGSVTVTICPHCGRPVLGDDDLDENGDWR